MSHEPLRVALLCARLAEANAARSVFVYNDAEATASRRQEHLQNALYHSLSLKDHINRTIVVDVFSWDEMGGLNSAMSTRRILQDCQYDWLFMTGICAGNPKKDVHLGDLIVAGKVVDLHFGKRTSERFSADITTLQFSSDLKGALDAVKEAVEGGWQSLITESPSSDPTISERADHEGIV